MPMSWAELNTGNPAWAKKEQFHVARKVEGLGKKLLEKMGWKEGMGLGKNAQGNAEPLVLDFKINREGLSSTEEGTNGPSFMGRKVFELTKLSTSGTYCLHAKFVTILIPNANSNQ